MVRRKIVVKTLHSLTRRDRSRTHTHTHSYQHETKNKQLTISKNHECAHEPKELFVNMIEFEITQSQTVGNFGIITKKKSEKLNIHHLYLYLSKYTHIELDRNW